MPKCSFCKSSYEFPRGLTFVLNDGTVLHFCSSKCRKNFNLGRKSRKVKWVKKTKQTRAEIVAEMKEEAEEKEGAKEVADKIKEEQAEQEAEDKKEEKPDKNSQKK